MDESTNIEYGKKLRFLRTAIPTIQFDIASKLKMSQQSYSELEKGKTQFSAKILNKVCKAFNITVQEFILIQPKLSPVKMDNPILNDTNVKILILNHKKQLLERDIEIIQLQLELKKYKRPSKKPQELAPIYVMI